MGDRLRTATVAVLVGTALLSGCSERQEASTTLPPPSAAPSTTAEALPPLGPPDFPVPPEARTKDAAGAEAFLRYWIDLVDRQRAIPAGQPLRDLGPTCATCARYAQVYDKAAAEGHRFVGGDLTLNDVTEPRLNGDTAAITFGTSAEAISRLDGSGNVQAQSPAANNLGSGIELTWSEGTSAWSVMAFDIG